jgi:glyoxylate reductase
VAKPVVVVTRRWPQAVEEALAARFDTRFNRADRALGQGELADALANADALCPTVTDRIGAELLDAATVRVRLVASFGVGFEHIDIEAARRRGIQVTNTPDVLTDCSADLAMLLILMCARRAGEGERDLRAGRWSGWRPTHLMGAKVSGATLGIIGMGRIGTALARRARHGFGMHILCHSRSPVAADLIRELGATEVVLDDLLARADFVSLHCPATAETRHLMDARRLARMRPSARLINTSRGAVVDEAALAAALAAGTIAGAGLDVYEAEPRVHAGLRTRENVVLLPHLGSASEASRTAMGMRVVENLDAWFAGKPLRDPVA